MQGRSRVPGLGHRARRESLRKRVWRFNVGFGSRNPLQTGVGAERIDSADHRRVSVFEQRNIPGQGMHQPHRRHGFRLHEHGGIQKRSIAGFRLLGGVAHERSDRVAWQVSNHLSGEHDRKRGRGDGVQVFRCFRHSRLRGNGRFDGVSQRGQSFFCPPIRTKIWDRWKAS